MTIYKLSTRLFSYSFVTFLLAFLLVQPAYADSDTYLGLKVGVTHYLSPDISTNSGSTKFKKNDTTALGGVIGTSYQAIPFLGLRTDFEYMYRFSSNTSIDSKVVRGDLVAHTALANLYIDVYPLPFMSIYVGAGIGLSVLEISLQSANTSLSTVFPYFAAQAGGGLQFILFEHLVFDLNVRYLYLGDWKRSFDSDNLKVKFSGIESTIGIAYRF